MIINMKKKSRDLKKTFLKLNKNVGFYHKLWLRIKDI